MNKKKGKKTGYAGFKRELRKEVFGVFEQNAKKPLNHKQVAAALGIADSGVRTLIFELLNEAKEEGKLKEIERGKFVLANAPSSSFEGIIDINLYGRGFVAVEGYDNDIEIPKGKTGFAFQGDTVEITFNPKSKKPSGKVVRVIERMRKAYVGVLEVNKNHAFLLPSDRKIHVDFFIPLSELNGAKNGEKVVVELLHWDRPENNPNGKVIKVLGKPGEHQTEIHAIIAEFGLPYEFPEEVEAFAEKIDPGFTKEEMAKRRDFRDILTFTIDPFDAKDFDDAISYRVLDNGNYEIGVHIADVSFYLQPDTILEQEAILRATSVYLVDRTIPMLPERLSNFLCSLRPNEDKMCFSAVFEMNTDAEVLNTWIGRTMIHSDRRFTYEEAQTVIETGAGDHAEAILTLDKLAKKLREKRYAAGSIDFNTDEVKFQLDEKGYPLGVYIKRMKDSNQLIEDFMLLANRKVAEFVGLPKNGVPKAFVYRVHDTPDAEKLTTLRNFLKNLGYKLPRANEGDSNNIIKELMKRVEGQPEEQIIKTMAIRSMAKAEYTTKNIGHFGLAFEYYTHFTSPIRRYPDVMVHRLIQRYLDNQPSADEKEYERKCRHSSLMEKRAAEAERASIKFKQVEYMLMRQGQIFEGIISGLASWGMYVEIVENKCEGLVPVNAMKDDFYEFDAERYVLRGSRKRKEYHMGDKVTIRVDGGNLQLRTLDFELVT